MGAPDPRDAPAKVVKWEIDIEKGRKFWAFQPPKKTAPPEVKDAAWPRGDIDRFLLSEMEAKGLKPVGDADPRTLLRRVTFDLIGLPPTPEDVDAFVKDYAARPQSALEAVVDKLLASPQFGERWGRHWLDVARYGESSGKGANIAYPHAWRYRDYVIDAFNDDKPYDQFVREQLAGDLLTARDDKEKAEFLVATGFLAIGPKEHAERNPRQFAMDLADEQIDATFQAFLGLTVACARCHDHKFDPIPQKDYYALSGIFRSTETCYGTVRVVQSNHPSPLIDLPRDAGATAGLEPLTAERRASLEKQIQDLKDQISKATGPNAFLQTLFLRTRSATLQSQLDLYDSDGAPKPLAMGVREGAVPVGQPALRPRRAGPAGRAGFARLPAGADDEAADHRPGERPARAGRLDRVEGQSADGPRHGQPRLAAPDGPRPGADPRQLRRLRPAAEQPGPARLSRRLLHRRRLVGEEADPRHRPEPGLSALLAVRREELRGRPRQRAGLADAEAAAGGRGAARHDAGAQRPARPDAAEGESDRAGRRGEHRFSPPFHGRPVA